MDQEWKDQIRSSMQEKDTQELISIWQQNDRAEWSHEAFAVIREILVQRTGELPAQGPAVYAQAASAAPSDTARGAPFGFAPLFAVSALSFLLGYMALHMFLSNMFTESLCDCSGPGCGNAGDCAIVLLVCSIPMVIVWSVLLAFVVSRIGHPHPRAWLAFAAMASFIAGIPTSFIVVLAGAF